MTPRRVLPSRTEPMAKDIVTFLGGPPGAHAAIGGARWWTPVRVLLALGSFVLSLAYMQKAPCLRVTTTAGGSPALDWEGNRAYTAACYTDAIPLYHGRGLDALHFPYIYSWVDHGHTRYMEYPVLTGLHQYLAAHLGRGIHAVWEFLHLPAVPQVATYWIANCMILAVAWMLAIIFLVKLTKNRVWDTVVVVASPLVIVHAFTNWDVLSIAACLAGLYLWSRHKHLAAGIGLGVGIAFKLWPLFVFGALCLLCLRHRQFRAMILATLGTVGSWVAINLPFYLIAPDGWGEFFRMSRTRSFEGSTIYQVIADIIEQFWGRDTLTQTGLLSVDSLNTLSLALLIVILATLSWVVLLKAPVKPDAPGPRVAHVVFVAVAAFVVTNKVWSPQFSLWLLPLAVLALPRWRLIFGWATVEAVFWYLRMWQFLPHDLAPPPAIIDLMILVRIALIGYMCVEVFRTMLGRIPDPVRDAHAGHDPAAGWDEGMGDERLGVDDKNKQESPSVTTTEKSNT
ncbi:DUF2029 domain-containing protein [Corynebacterium sp. zg254]|uniref:DUF2029 domain-containing protein n=1 Tax=Corynebacterium zhongnanshanii TaxID=2768834 RepID=A0ABQ6VC23_9CORY|nr:MULTISPECIES: glycosyltransferase 87 family protein [Corynebacterium]KAB3519204.1 DUF2029 domain-containing protein [Corynebacterium zhongnanshanii]MCR5915057.1 DUF2029 domain-containing protein [Corynebacterium sp. zg254]